MKTETSVASTYNSCDLLLTSLPKNVSRFFCNSSSGDARPKQRLARPSLWFLWCCCRRPAALDILCRQRHKPRRHLLASQSQAMQDEHGSNLSIGSEQTSGSLPLIELVCPELLFNFFCTFGLTSSICCKIKQYKRKSRFRELTHRLWILPRKWSIDRNWHCKHRCAKGTVRAACYEAPGLLLKQLFEQPVSLSQAWTRKLRDPKLKQRIPRTIWRGYVKVFWNLQFVCEQFLSAHIDRFISSIMQ